MSNSHEPFTSITTEHEHATLLNKAELASLVASESFAELLEPTDYYSENAKLWQLRNHPGILVRESQVTSEKTAPEQLEKLVSGKHLFTELQTTYGIRIVDMLSCIGKNSDGHDAVFTFVEKIDGQNLQDTAHIPLEAKNEIETFFSQLAQYYADAGEQQGSYWSDFNTTQVVYGQEYGQPDCHIYVVDVDAEFYKPGENALFPIAWPLLQLARGIIETEAKFKPPVRFEEVRSMLLSTVLEMLAEEPDSDPLRSSKELLQTTG